MQRERIRSGDEDEGETRMRGNILGWDWIGINRSCVRTGSDTRLVHDEAGLSKSRLGSLLSEPSQLFQIR